MFGLLAGAGGVSKSSQAALVEALVNAECSANEPGVLFQGGPSVVAGEGRASTAHSNNKQSNGDAGLNSSFGNNNNVSGSSDRLSLPQVRRSGGRCVRASAGMGEGAGLAAGVYVCWIGLVHRSSGRCLHVSWNGAEMR